MPAQKSVPDRAEFRQQPPGVLFVILRDDPHQAYLQRVHIVQQVIRHHEREHGPPDEGNHIGGGAGHPLGDLSDPIPRGGKQGILQHGDIGGGEVERKRPDDDRFGRKGLDPDRNAVDEGPHRRQNAGKLLLQQVPRPAGQADQQQDQDSIQDQNGDRAGYPQVFCQEDDQGIEQVGQDQGHDQRNDQNLEPDQEESDRHQDGQHDDQFRICGPAR